MSLYFARQGRRTRRRRALLSKRANARQKTARDASAGVPVKAELTSTSESHSKYRCVAAEYTIRDICYDGELFLLKRPRVLSFRQQDDLFVCALDPLGISGSGTTPADAFNAFCEVFSSHWHWIAKEDNRNLGPELQRLKPILLGLVSATFKRKGDEFHPYASTQASPGEKGFSETGFSSPYVLAGR